MNGRSVIAGGTSNVKSIYLGIGSCIILTSMILLSTNSNLETVGSPDPKLKWLSSKIEHNDDVTIYDDFDFYSQQCGYRKCFFRSKSDGDFGYLIGHPRFFLLDRKSFRLAMRMEEEYRVNQPFFALPESYPLPDWVATQINKNRFMDTNLLLISKVRAIQKEAVMTGCNMFSATGPKSTEYLKRKLPIFVKNSPDPYEGFFKNFERSIDSTKKIISKNPCLFKDFQFMVDSFGNVHHLDFDRCYQHGSFASKESIQKCFKSLSYLVLMTKDLAEVEVTDRERQRQGNI